MKEGKFTRAVLAAAALLCAVCLAGCATPPDSHRGASEAWWLNGVPVGKCVAGKNMMGNGVYGIVISGAQESKGLDGPWCFVLSPVAAEPAFLGDLFIADCSAALAGFSAERLNQLKRILVQHKKAAAEQKASPGGPAPVKDKPEPVEDKP